MYIQSRGEQRQTTNFKRLWNAVSAASMKWKPPFSEYNEQDNSCVISTPIKNYHHFSFDLKKDVLFTIKTMFLLNKVHGYFYSRYTGQCIQFSFQLPSLKWSFLNLFLSTHHVSFASQYLLFSEIIFICSLVSHQSMHLIYLIQTLYTWDQDQWPAWGVEYVFKDREKQAVKGRRHIGKSFPQSGCRGTGWSIFSLSFPTERLFQALFTALLSTAHLLTYWGYCMEIIHLPARF